MTHEKLPAKIQVLKEAMENLPEFQNQSCKHSFKGYMRKIKQIDKFNSVSKYKIVFIGEPGKGKTTAICNWLNLLKRVKENEKRPEAISLLATASGRTTAAEVHIKQVTTASKIRIEYMSIDQQKEYIKEYCSFYYSWFNMTDDDANDTIDSDTAENSIVHSEIDRIIRNMASLENLPSKIKEQSQDKHNKILSFMKQFENATSFYAYILDIIDLEKRQCSVIPYKEDVDFEEWLSKTFKEVNDGKRPDCSIASKIYVDICSKDFSLELPDCIGEIIDTIGLDSTVRTDLQELMSAEDTICFLMDDLNNVPSHNIRNLIKETFLNKWDQYCLLKTSIFVKSPAKDLESVNEADGDSDVGIDIKTTELKRIMDNEKIQYILENTLFSDSCAAYIFKPIKIAEFDGNGKPVINKSTGKPKFKINQIIEQFDNELALEYRQSVTNKIQMMIEQLRAKLQNDADDIRVEVENLLELELKFVSTEADKELKEIREKVAEIKREIPQLRSRDVVQTILKKAIDDIHWKTIKKMNSLYGGYNRWHTDIYTQIMQAGRECFSDAISPVSSEINPLLIDVRSKDARSVTGGYLNQYNWMVKAGTEEIGHQFIQWALYKCFSPRSDDNPFWCEVNSIHGNGYKNQVKDRYENIIYVDGGTLAQMITAKIETIIDKLLRSFTED